MAEQTTPNDAELSDRLTNLQYEVTQNGATEQAFSGIYWDMKDDGTYHCVVCDQPLFSSDTKFESGSGWPSFFEAIDPERVRTETDGSLGMQRIEVKCGRCDAHLGHVFPDGPKPSGQRYCINSASLDLARQKTDDE